MPKTKNKKCRVCSGEFKPFSTTQVVCQPSCAIEYTKRQNDKQAQRQAKIERKQRRERKIALKSRSQWVRDTQAAFNKYIRERDDGQPCISCDKSSLVRRTLLTGSAWDCGHYRSIGSAPELRFEPLNAHLQCVTCNRHLSGNTVEYRKRLVVRIGHKKLEWLEGYHPPKNYTIDDLKELIAHFKKLTREIVANRNG